MQMQQGPQKHMPERREPSLRNVPKWAAFLRDITDRGERIRYGDGPPQIPPEHVSNVVEMAPLSGTVFMSAYHSEHPIPMNEATIGLSKEELDAMAIWPMEEVSADCERMKNARLALNTILLEIYEKYGRNNVCSIMDQAEDGTVRISLVIANEIIKKP